ncbi:MAG: hypothetical protein JSS98_09265 [Bacteroidetes bacterium]|nr:hypothetical protein [Bacteroidota bacterium]
MFEFLKAILIFFEKNNIPYMLSGSVAMSNYTVSRFTKDFDFVVSLTADSIPLLSSFFNEGYYCDEDSIKEAIRNKSMFNIIDHKSNYKADFVILKDEPFRLEEFRRRKMIDLKGTKLYIVSPEDLLLSKIIWIQDYQSPLQMEDIRQLDKLDTLDRDYISYWLHNLKLNTFELLKSNDRHS